MIKCTAKPAPDRQQEIIELVSGASITKQYMIRLIFLTASLVLTIFQLFPRVLLPDTRDCLVRRSRKTHLTYFNDI